MKSLLESVTSLKTKRGLGSPANIVLHNNGEISFADAVALFEETKYSINLENDELRINLDYTADDILERIYMSAKDYTIIGGAINGASRDMRYDFYLKKTEKNGNMTHFVSSLRGEIVDEVVFDDGRNPIKDEQDRFQYTLMYGDRLMSKEFFHEVYSFRDKDYYFWKKQRRNDES